MDLEYKKKETGKKKKLIVLPEVKPPVEVLPTAGDRQTSEDVSEGIKLSSIRRPESGILMNSNNATSSIPTTAAGNTKDNKANPSTVTDEFVNDVLFS